MAATESTALLATCDRRLPSNSSCPRSAATLAQRAPSNTSGYSNHGSERKPLTVWQLAALTVLLAGIQFVWTVELGYGTPYLLSLGLSKPLMTLVWMAGPLSGLIIQPVVGRLSDRCASQLGRRRPFIIGGAAFVVVAVITIAYARQMAVALAHILGVVDSSEPGAGTQGFVTRVSIVLAVIGFYVLDFSINTSQACARALALDIPPLEQQDVANAYAGRMLNLGSVTGYMVGFIDLRALLPWKTESQMQALCLVAVAVFTLTITLTCVCVREVPLRVPGADDQLDASEHGQARTAAAAAARGPRGEWSEMLSAVAEGMAKLPTPVQRVCNVQFFAWIAWFPFLFFATTWVTEIMARTGDITDPEFIERATRAGSFALFLYSLASLGFSVLMPMFVAADDNDARRSWLKISLRAMWRLSLVAMGVTLLSTRFVGDVRAATVLIVAMAFPWALAMWAPFALVGEYVAISAEHPAETARSPAGDDGGVALLPAKAATLRVPGRHLSPAYDDSGEDGELVVGSQATVTGVAGGALVARRALLRGESIASTIQTDQSTPAPTVVSPHTLGGPERAFSVASTAHATPPPAAEDSTGDGQASPPPPRQRLESGTILGIHNMYVVFPQFVINGISTLVFAWLGSTATAASPAPARSVEFMAMDAVYMRLAGGTDSGVGAVGLVLRIGGASALVAAAATFSLFDRRRIRAYIATENHH
ncbi:hypothetical protein H4R19_001836 [Coemansia spiralis]|nr:hypothetical protein H4R19_001836 [Coemansia spiralis]